MIKVYAPHGIFEYPEANHFAYVTGGELDVVDDNDEIVATFDTGQWQHAESLHDPAEQEAAEPEVKAWLTLEDFERGSTWTDCADSTLAYEGGGTLQRSYGWRESYSSDQKGWVRSALNDYGPYIKVVS